ncbi:hydrogenase expression/formation protein HypE [Tengunoibacter tsumagoiensis]|uniref:Hydrogenase expression/formation protein HypE n=1 Tax=Tengunoibacter tsumagoiensis TaxID=2014871 RepID=A0A402A167_9CHLR|nr:hydrogenase expression/formation protein HypE [Tengunoibacter tsumagoiensis]GCE12799.1 hydrogenase expression/formation protein HypE [Tengunoibacter tsumagoiensis]
MDEPTTHNPQTAGQIDEVLQKIEKTRQARRHKFYLRDEKITLSHGSGGKSSHNLIEGVFAPAFSNPLLDAMDDSATFNIVGTNPRLAFTTDTYVVSPLFFPGGDIGRLAVHGTINDLVTSGAQPLYLSAGFILEEGFPIADLRKIVGSMAESAKEAGVFVVTGDTKVVQRGKADGVFINTAGVGLAHPTWQPGQNRLQAGDKVLLSGPIGDHGIAIMLAREALEIETEVQSDTAPLHTLVAALFAAVGDSIHCLKDPTRGGVATTLNEMALSSDVAIALDEHAIPVHSEVRGACEILGLDPLTIANEGKMLVIVSGEKADEALAAMRKHPLGRETAIIGSVQSSPEGMVFLRTDIGGMRVLDMLVGDPLPRIC